jgi:hypothetical protein
MHFLLFGFLMDGSRRRRPLLSVVCWCEMLLNANVCCSLHPTDANGAFTSAAARFLLQRNYILCTTTPRCIGVFAGTNECNSRRIYLYAHTWETFNSRIENICPHFWNYECWCHCCMHDSCARSRGCIARVHFSFSSIVQHFVCKCVHRIATHIMHQGGSWRRAVCTPIRSAHCW